MNKIYLVDGKPYEVAPHREEEFLSTMKSQGKSPVLQDQGNQKDPATSATAGSETTAQTQEVNPPQTNQQENTESTSEDTSSESQEDKPQLPPDGGFFEDLLTSAQQGFSAGQSVDEAFQVYSQGANISDENLEAYIKAAKESEALPPTREQIEFQKTQEREGGGIYGTLKGLYENPGFFPQMITSSLATMAGSFTSGKDVAGVTLASAGVGAGVGATAGSAGFVAGPAGVATTAGGALTGTVIGATSGLVGAMETGLTLTDLLREELDGKEFNKENIRSILEDPDAIDRITSGSLARGLTIGAVEGLTMGLSRGIGSTMVRSGKSAMKVGATTTGTEVAGAFTGEVAGQAAAGQEIDLGEATLEAVGEVGSVTGPVSSADLIYKAIKNGPASYKINGEKRSRSEVERLVKNPNTKVEELAKIDIEIENDANLKNFVEAKKKDAFNETQVDAKVSDVADRKKLVELEKKRVKAKMDMDKTGIFAVPGAKENLENVEAEISSVIEKYSGVDGRTKDVRARKKEAKTVRDATLEKTIKFAEEQGKVIGKETIVADNNKDAQEIFNRAREEHNAKNPDDQIAEADVSNSDGFVVGNTIVINKDIAGRTGQINVGAHELLHGVVAKHMKSLSDGDRTKLITDFKNTLTNEQFDYIKKKIDARGDLDIDSTEEWLNIMSDGITKGDISFNEGVFDKIKNFIQEIARKFGIRKEFQNGRQVYNFMKDYQASIKKNKLSERAIKLAEEGAPVTETKFSVEASERVQKAYDDMGEAAAMDIIDEFKPIVTKQARRFRDVPGYSEEDIISEIEIGKRGIFDLIREYKPESGVPLAAYINKFLPVRANEAAGRILGEQFTDDVTEAKAVTATETAEDTMVAETKPKRKGIVLADRLKVKDQITPIAEKYVKDNDLTGTTYKKTPNIATDIVGNLMGIPAKKIVSNANLSKPELANAQMFINKNADMLQSMLPEGATEDGTATGVQKVLLDKFYNKKSKRAKTKAGLATQSKRPDITRSEFLEVFGIVDGKPQRDDRNTSSRVLALAKQLDRAMSNQAIREVLTQDDTQATTVQQMASGKSPVMFSKSAQDLLTKVGRTVREQFDLEFNGADKLLENSIGSRTYKYDTKEDIDNYFKDVKNILIPTFPQGLISPSLLRPSNRILPLKGKKSISIDGVETTIDEYFTQQRDELFNEELNYGPDFTGEAKNWKAKTYGKVFGNSAKEFDTAKNNGTIENFNKQNGAMHKQMWQRIDKAIKQDKNNAKVFGNFLKITSQKANHPHRLGAEFIGWSPKAKGSRGKLYEWEHAMPATSAYLYLLDASLNNLDFNQAYDLVMKNYKLIALDAAMDDKLKVAGLTTSMPADFNMLNNIWWERYFNKDVAKVDGGIDPNSIVLTNGKTLGQDLNIKSDGNLAIVQESKETIKSKKNLAKAKQNLIKYSKSGKAKGMSTFDFDETLIIGGKNFVVATDPDSGNTVQISSEEWPIKGPDYAAQGYEFDFSDFANVRGGKEGPLLQKMKNQIAKYGNKNVFVLTARQQASAEPIQQWLKTQGIDIPLKNITGLGKSEGEAKAQWMLGKFAEGYNDMYFVDDAMPNVRAVKQVLDALDIKSKVVQAKVKFSRDGSAEFNKMLERNTGVSRDKIFSEAQAKIRGAKTSSFKFFVPPSAEDFKGLLYNFLGRGRQGNADMAFFKEYLLDPFTKGIRDINFAKQRTSEEFKTLRKENPDVVKEFNKKAANSDYTVNDAIRVYLWDKNGIDIPGISEQEVSLLSDYVKGDPKIKAFADVLGNISRAEEGYVTPDENWVVGSIASDLFGQSNQVNRAEYLSEWKNNVDVIFSPENINKIEAVYGTDFRDALENMLYRMETGSNRVTGTKDKVVNKFMDWINGSVGAVMFFNTRSAMLQTLSTVNFIDWADNNIFKASKAFANQPQYWKDFMTLFNSDMLKQRRAGMQIDVNLAELTNTVAKSNMAGKSKAAIRYLLQIGFTPTQIADSFAIASGGATYYRNKINKYLKNGMSQKEAETQAFEDFQEIAEETQQSSRPDLISQQQAGTLGRLILAWQNTPMQYTRLTKKAISDLVNRRGDWKSHVSRILYYGAMQNIIFGSLQTGLAFLMFGGDEDEEKTKTKTTRVANGALDTLLRGTGVYGAMVSTLKNTIMKYLDERDKPYGKRELSKVAIEAVQLSPPIGSKLRKIMSAIYSYEYNKDVPEKMGLDIDNPALNVVGNLVEATTNAPLARAVRKAQNLEEAINGNHETWKRVALIAGWDKWSLDVKDKELEEAKAKVKQERADKKKAESDAKKKENKRKRAEAEKNRKDGDDLDGDGKKEYRCKANTRGGKGPRCKNITENKNKRCYAHQ